MRWSATSGRASCTAPTARSSAAPAPASCRSAPSTGARSSSRPSADRAPPGRLPRTDTFRRVPDRALHCRLMRFFVTVLALFALLAPQAAQAKGERAAPLAKRASSPTASRVTSATSSPPNRASGSPPTAPGSSCSTASPAKRWRRCHLRAGFKLPFTPRVPRSGHLVVLDSGGFPPVGPPVVYDYDVPDRAPRVQGELTRTVDFAGNPMGFAEDVEVLPNGEYVVSESIFGGLWLIGRDGRSAAGWCPTTAVRPWRTSARASSRTAAPAPSAICRSRRAAASRPAPARWPRTTPSSTSVRPARAASSGSRSRPCSTRSSRQRSARRSSSSSRRARTTSRA